MNKSLFILLGAIAALAACAPQRPNRLFPITSSYIHPTSGVLVTSYKLRVVGDKCFVNSNISEQNRYTHRMSAIYTAVPEGNDIRCSNGQFTNHTLRHTGKSQRNLYFIGGKPYGDFY